MAEAPEILCSRCGTPFPKDKGKTAVTCVVCGQLRPDLDMTLDDEDDAEDLGAALGTSAGGGTGPGAGPAAEPEDHVLRVAAPTGGGGIDSPPEPPRRPVFRTDQPYVAMDTMGVQPMLAGIGGPPPLPGGRLLDRVGPVLLVVCPLAAGMAGGLNMLSRTEDFSLGTWCAVGVVFVAVAGAALAAGLVGAGVLYLVRLRWNILLRLVFLAAAGAVCYYGVQELPSHLQVRYDGLPGFVSRQ